MVSSTGRTAVYIHAASLSVCLSLSLSHCAHSSVSIQHPRKWKPHHAHLHGFLGVLRGVGRGHQRRQHRVLRRLVRRTQPRTGGGRRRGRGGRGGGGGGCRPVGVSSCCLGGGVGGALVGLFIAHRFWRQGRTHTRTTRGEARVQGPGARGPGRLDVVGRGTWQGAVERLFALLGGKAPRPPRLRLATVFEHLLRY